MVKPNRAAQAALISAGVIGVFGLLVHRALLQLNDAWGIW